MAKMTLKKAESLYKKAHKNLTPAEEEDAHKAEKLLKKKGIEAEREDGKFVFKKGVKEGFMNDLQYHLAQKYFPDEFYRGSGKIHPVTGEVIEYPEHKPLKDILVRKASEKLKNFKDKLKGKKKQRPFQEEEGIPF